jgi:hypothetical protein
MPAAKFCTKLLCASVTDAAALPSSAPPADAAEFWAKLQLCSVADALAAMTSAPPPADAVFETKDRFVAVSTALASMYSPPPVRALLAVNTVDSTMGAPFASAYTPPPVPPEVQLVKELLVSVRLQEPPAEEDDT